MAKTEEHVQAGPKLQSFDSWLAAHKAEVQASTEPAPTTA